MADDAMTITERRKYLTKMQSRYRSANRGERSRLLTEMAAVTGMHRKSLIRLMGQSSLRRIPRQKQRGKVYGSEMRQVVRVVWESLDCLCAERLTPQLLTTARHLATVGDLVLTAAIERQLAQISEATVTRMLADLPRVIPRLPRRAPGQANRTLRAVPMGRIPWQTTIPGSFEVDLVHHSELPHERRHFEQVLASPIMSPDATGPRPREGRKGECFHEFSGQT